MNRFLFVKSKPVRFPYLSSAFSTVFLIVAMPLLIAKVPPYADYVNHLARIYLIAYGVEDSVISHFYSIKWVLIPNLAFDLVGPTLTRWFGIFTAGKLFILAYMVLIMAGVHALYYSLFRHLSLSPLVAGLFIHNGEARDGLVNYFFGLGLSIWGVALWIALRQHNPFLRALASILCLALIFICHLEAVALYGLGILAYEISRLSIRQRLWDKALLIDISVVAVPFLVVPMLMEAGPTAGRLGTIRWAPFSGFYGFVFPKLHGLIQVVRNGNLRGDFLIECLIVVVLASFAIMAMRRRRLRVHPFGRALVAIAVPIYLLMPDQFLGAADVDVRLPVGILFFWLAALEWSTPSVHAQHIFLAGIIGFAALRIAFIESVWFPFERVRADFETSLQEVQPGSRVLVVRPHDPKTALHGLFYLPCLAIIERSSLVSLAFSDPSQQVLRVNPPFRPFAGGYNDDPLDVSDLLAEKLPADASPGARLYWKDWTNHYDYVYVIWTTDEANPAPQRLSQLYTGQNFQLYRIIKHRVLEKPSSE